MCYSYKVIWTDDKAKHFKVAHKDLEGDVVFFPKSQVPVVLEGRDQRPVMTSMHWDLLPRWYQGEPSPQQDLLLAQEPHLEQVLTHKSSFHSYNARIESVATKASYEKPWRESKRCLLPVSQFWERPNMPSAPDAMRHQSFELEVQGEYALAGLYDVWEGWALDGQGLSQPIKFPSVTVLTTSGVNSSVMQSIYHDRAPGLIHADNYSHWLSSHLSPQEAQEMVNCLGDFTLKDNVRVA